MTVLKMTVLIVDDDVFSRMMLMHLIAGCGEVDIVEAEDGLDAWQQLDNGLRPAILFCDLRMPRLSGMALLQRVKRDPRWCSMPFVLVSTANEQGIVQQAIAAGAGGYLIKPFQADGVRFDLRAMLDEARADWAANLTTAVKTAVDDISEGRDGVAARTRPGSPI